MRRFYSDNKDVTLFWKTHMLYYVKTEKLYKSLKIDHNGTTVFFDVSKLQGKQAWEKKDLIYELVQPIENNTVTLNVLYSTRGRVTKLDEIIKALGKSKISITRDQLQDMFKIFENQSEVDLFINKNAKEFLREQFNHWLFDYTFSDDSLFSENRLNQLKILKDIAYKIIDFVSQFETELVKIWQKPKFILNSNYVISLDRIQKLKGGIALIKKILSESRFPATIEEWKELKLLNEDEKLENITILDEQKKKVVDTYLFFPIDTKYFDGKIKTELCQAVENLDDELDGWLIRSENFQALNTILPKFQEKVSTIFIDPPFNKEKDADYFYSVKFRNSTWLTMLENRISLAKSFLPNTGSMFVRCDYNGNMYVRMLMEEIFGSENFRNEIAVTRTKTALYIATPEKMTNKLGESYDNIYWFSKDPDVKFPKISKGIIKTRREPYWKDLKSFYDRPANNYELLGIKLKKGCSWVWKKEDVMEAINNYNEFLQRPVDIGTDKAENAALEKYWIETGMEKRFAKKIGETVKYWIEPIKKSSITDWTFLEGYARSWNFPTENSEALLKIILEFTTDRNDLVMDFFTGSGTTIATAHKLGRKWIGIEMGEHYYSVVLPRMKKVIAYDPSSISKDPEIKEFYNKQNAGGFFKYFEMEQYEQVIKRAVYLDSEPLHDKTNIYEQYVFMKYIKLLDGINIDDRNNKVNIDLSKLYEDIDLAETLSCLYGKKIVKITGSTIEYED